MKSIILLLCLLCLIEGSAKANLDWSTIQEGLVVGPGVGRVRETDFCGVVRGQTIDLKDALLGRELAIAIQYGEGFDFFQYNPDEELSPSNPTGMVASLLDQLALRAGFFWRNSFVAYNTETVNTLFGTGNGKWDKMLNWTISKFDLSVDKWFLTTERLESEVVFLNSWFDATLILVDEGDEVELNLLGFAAPFDASVWWTILGTVIFSSFCMMFIEYLEGKRDGRSMSTWIGDHLYLSNMAFSQNFEYDNPGSGAGRVFLSSFAFWAMLIGATYTANLASLLVENALSSEVSSIKGAMEAELSICIHDGSASETIVKSLFPQMQTYEKVVKCSTTAEMYRKLDNEGCDLLVGTRQEFQIYKIQKQFGCGLLQAGDDLHSSSANFAIKFDPLNCDSVLAYVMNIHLHAMSIDGNITELWDSYIDAIEGTCASEDDDEERRRRLVDATDTSDYVSRSLKGRGSPGGGGGASEAEGGAVDTLQIKGMAGVFLFHGGGTAIALLLAIYAQFRKRYIKKKPFTNQEKLAEKEEIKSELQRRYEDLKHDFMSQLDDLFQAQMAKQKSNVGELPHGETSSDGSAFPTASSLRVSRINMDGSITSTRSKTSLISL